MLGAAADGARITALSNNVNQTRVARLVEKLPDSVQKGRPSA
jgi:hypothetical protein